MFAQITEHASVLTPKTFCTYTPPALWFTSVDIHRPITCAQTSAHGPRATCAAQK